MHGIHAHNARDVSYEGLGKKLRSGARDKLFPRQVLPREEESVNC